MAEESKSIALVILGIVAVIAIVGLVLLFTGARKGATGEYFFGVKEYGGAIKGSVDPYARSFAGKSFEYDQGEPYYYANIDKKDVGPTQVSQFTTYGKAIGKAPSTLTACTGLGNVLSKDSNQELAMLGHQLIAWSDGATQQQYYEQYGPSNCIKLSQVPAVVNQVYTVNDPAYASYTALVNDQIQYGAFACCKPASLGL